MLTDLVERMVEIINTPGKAWSDWATAEPCLDPATAFQDQKSGIYVLPLVNGYNLDESPKRHTVVQLISQPACQLLITTPFTTFHTEGKDVADWSEIKKILNFREAIEKLLIKELTRLETVEAEPPMEVKFGVRWFCCTTDFIFEEASCTVPEVEPMTMTREELLQQKKAAFRQRESGTFTIEI